MFLFLIVNALYKITPKSDVYSIGNVIWEFLERKQCYGDMKSNKIRTEIVDYRYILKLNGSRSAKTFVLRHILGRCHSWHASERAEAKEIWELIQNYRFKIMKEVDSFYETRKITESLFSTGASRSSRSSPSSYSSSVGKSLRLSSVSAVNVDDLLRDRRPTKFDLQPRKISKISKYSEKYNSVSGSSNRIPANLTTGNTEYNFSNLPQQSSLTSSLKSVKNPFKLYTYHTQIILLVLIYVSFVASFKLLLSHQ